MSQQPDKLSTDAGYEVSDAPAAPIVGFLVTLAGSLAATMLVAAWVVGAFEKQAVADEQPHPMRDFRTGVPGPRLQARPDLEIEEHRRVEELQVSSYGWVDPSSGLVRVPLDKAKELILRDGLPVVTSIPEPAPDANSDISEEVEEAEQSALESAAGEGEE